MDTALRTLRGIVFTAAGLVILASGFLLVSQTQSFIQHAHLTQGVAISSESAWTPVVQFTTQDGQAVEFISKAQGHSPFYALGDSVPVIYNPENPEEAEINEPNYLWATHRALFLVGCVFSIVGPAELILLAIQRRREPG